MYIADEESTVDDMYFIHEKYIIDCMWRIKLEMMQFQVFGLFTALCSNFHDNKISYKSILEVRLYILHLFAKKLFLDRRIL